VNAAEKKMTVNVSALFFVQVDGKTKSIHDDPKLAARAGLKAWSSRHPHENDHEVTILDINHADRWNDCMEALEPEGE
jgi:hypothetical protein